MSFSLAQDELVSRFDTLVQQGFIHYTSPVPVDLEDQGFRVRKTLSTRIGHAAQLTSTQFEFRICRSLVGKPQAEDALPPPPQQLGNSLAVNPECFGDGSDIAIGHPDILVKAVNGTHLLVINKFPVFRPHLLLLTADSYRPQDEALSFEDLQAAWTVLQGADKEFYVLFNCTPTAGASRTHKHMQLIPHPKTAEGASAGFRLFPDYDPPLHPSAVPFLCFVQHFEGLPKDIAATSEHLVTMYLQLLKQARASLHMSPENPVCPHNVILTQDWIAVIPRQRKEFHGITANGAGMMGSVWLMNDTQLDEWKARGPAKVLSALGLPPVS